MKKPIKSIIVVGLIAAGLLAGCGTANRGYNVNQYDGRYNVNGYNNDGRINTYNRDAGINNYRYSPYSNRTNIYGTDTYDNTRTNLYNTSYQQGGLGTSTR